MVFFVLDSHKNHIFHGQWLTGENEITIELLHIVRLKKQNKKHLHVKDGETSFVTLRHSFTSVWIEKQIPTVRGKMSRHESKIKNKIFLNKEKKNNIP